MKTKVSQQAAVTSVSSQGGQGSQGVEKVVNALLSSRWVYREDAQGVRKAFLSKSVSQEQAGWLKQQMACHLAGLPSQVSLALGDALGRFAPVFPAVVATAAFRASVEGLQDFLEVIENAGIAGALNGLANAQADVGADVGDSAIRGGAVAAMRDGVNQAKTLQIVRDSVTGATPEVDALAGKQLTGMIYEDGMGIPAPTVASAVAAYTSGLAAEDREVLACYLGSGGRPCGVEETSRLLQLPAADVRRQFQRVVSGFQSSLTRLGLKHLSGDSRRLSAWVSSVATNCKMLAAYEPTLFRAGLDVSSQTRRGTLVWTTPFESADDVCLRSASGEEFVVSKTAGNRFTSAAGEDKSMFDAFMPVNDDEVEAYYDTRRNISQHTWTYIGKDVFVVQNPAWDLQPGEHVASQDVYGYLKDNFGYDDKDLGEYCACGFVTGFVFDSIGNKVSDVVYNELHRPAGDKTKTAPLVMGGVFEDLGAERHGETSSLTAKYAGEASK
jgi:hypothetical protein